MMAGMVPMALAIGEGGEQVAPLGRAVIGGLAAATFATLFILPSVFAIVQARASILSASLDPDDPDSKPFAAPAFRAIAAEEPPVPPSFVFLRTPMWDKAEAVTKTTIEQAAKELGAFELELPASYAAAWDAQRAIMAADMAHNLGPLIEKGEVSTTLQELISEGRKVTAVQYLAALADARRYTAALAELFERADAIVTPSARGVAPQDLTGTGDPVFCTLWSLTGMPALNVPVLTGEDGLPLGLQLIGPHFGESRLLSAAHAYQRETDFHRRAPAAYA